MEEVCRTAHVATVMGLIGYCVYCCFVHYYLPVGGKKFSSTRRVECAPFWRLLYVCAWLTPSLSLPLGPPIPSHLISTVLCVCDISAFLGALLCSVPFRFIVAVRCGLFNCCTREPCSIFLGFCLPGIPVSTDQEIQIQIQGLNSFFLMNRLWSSPSNNPSFSSSSSAKICPLKLSPAM